LILGDHSHSVCADSRLSVSLPDVGSTCVCVYVALLVVCVSFFGVRNSLKPATEQILPVMELATIYGLICPAGGRLLRVYVYLCVIVVRIYVY
jgi:hypothetical protein